MQIFSRFSCDFQLRSGIFLLLLLAVFSGVCKSQTQEEIYGSGDFILNQGPIYSSAGTWIGNSASTYSGGSVTLGTSSFSGLLVLRDNLSHSINASTVNGHVTKSPDQAVYDFGTSVTLTAVADLGYVFEKWTMNGDDSLVFRYPTITLSAIYDYELVAHFVPISRLIELYADDLSWGPQVVGGISSGNFKIRNGGNSPLTVENITYPAGFNGSWNGTIDPGSSKTITVNFAPSAAGSYSGDIVVNSDATAGTPTIPVSAVAQNAYSLIGTSSFGVSNTHPISRKYWQGSIVTLKAMPVTGYVFMNWTEEGEILSSDANFDLPITQEHQVWANYLPESRNLKLVMTRSFGASQAGSIYQGTVSIVNVGTLPVYFSNLQFDGRGMGRIQVKGSSSCWIEPGSTAKVSVAFSPFQKKSYRLRVSAIAKDLSSPVGPLVLRGVGLSRSRNAANVKPTAVIGACE